MSQEEQEEEDHEEPPDAALARVVVRRLVEARLLSASRVDDARRRIETGRAGQAEWRLWLEESVLNDTEATERDDKPNADTDHTT